LRKFVKKTGDSEDNKTNVSQKAVKQFFLLVALTLVLIVVYRYFLDSPYHFYIFWGYVLAAAALAFVYVIYNRGMSRKGVTKDMLPDSWSDEEKERFIESGRQRLARSKWMLTILFAFIAVFAVDAIELFVFPMFKGLFS